MENTFGPIPCDPDAFLLADMSVATVQGGCRGDYSLIEHQRNRAFTGKKPMF